MARTKLRDLPNASRLQVGSSNAWLKEVNIALNKAHFPVTTLGPGQRVGLWLQGCSIHCSGCLSRDTWEAGPTHETSVASLMKAITPWLEQADGVTLSGGEPFDQPDALENLIKKIRSVPRPKQSPLDVLAYSGYTRARLATRHATLVAHLDGLITEPFDEHAGNTLRWRGSDNQRFHIMSALGESRYGADIDHQPWTENERRLDVVVEESAVWMAGIPRLGELERLQSSLAQRGYTCQTSQACQTGARL